MKLGTQLEHVIRIILRYRAITDLTSDLYGSIFFQISDKIINFQTLILLMSFLKLHIVRIFPKDYFVTKNLTYDLWGNLF